MTIVSYEAGRFAIVGKVERIEAMIDRERVSWFVRRIVQPPERPDDPLPENIVGSA